MRLNMDNNPVFIAGIQSVSFVEVPEKYDPKRPEGMEAPQDRDKHDVPLWIFHCLWADEDAAFINSEPLQIKVSSATRPPVPRGGCAVIFTGLYQNSNARRNGGFNVSYSAEKFQLDAVAPVKQETPAPVGSKK